MTSEDRRQVRFVQDKRPLVFYIGRDVRRIFDARIAARRFRVVVVGRRSRSPDRRRLSKPATPKSAKPFTPPKTPWGDPDVSGNVTNVFEASTPFERPDDFAGRRLEEVQGDELANFRADLQKRTLANFEGPLHGPDSWWQNIYDLRKGGQAWFVVDPPDGRIPPMTAGSAAAAAGVRAPGGSYAPGEFWTSASDFNLYDRCITRGLPGSMMPAIYGNSYRIVQSPGQVAIQYEMIHETRVIPLDGRPHVEQEHPPRHGRRARPLGRQHARRRDDELHGAQRLPRRQRRHG